MGTNNDRPNPRTPYYINQSVVKAVAILRSFSKDTPQQTVKEISDRLMITRSVAQKLVLTLVDLGLLARDAESRKYLVSPRVMEIASPFLHTSPLIVEGRSLVEKLVALTDMTCALGIRDGIETLYLVSVEAQASVKANSLSGERTPLHCTATGKCLLAFTGEAELTGLLPSLALRRFTEHTIVDVDALKCELERIRERGHAINLEERVVGLCGIAVPIHNGTRKVVAAISVGIPKASVPRSQYAEMASKASAIAKELEMSIDSHNLV